MWSSLWAYWSLETALLHIAIGSSIIAALVVLVWRDILRDEERLRNNFFEVRVIMTSSQPVRPVIQDYPDQFRFRDELFWHTSEGHVIRFQAFPLTLKEMRKLRREGVRI